MKPSFIPTVRSAPEFHRIVQFTLDLLVGYTTDRELSDTYAIANARLTLPRRLYIEYPAHYTSNVVEVQEGCSYRATNQSPDRQGHGAADVGFDRLSLRQPQDGQHGQVRRKGKEGRN